MHPTEPLATEEHDTPAEVDATFRTLRRVALGHVVVFAAVVIAVPLLTTVLGWWSEGRLLGGMSPMFALAAVGLYVFFFVLCLAAATLSTAVEQRMLGGPANEAKPQEPQEPHDGTSRP